MNARETIEAALRGAAGWGDSDRVDRLLAGHRAKVLAEAKVEVVAWLRMKAAEDPWWNVGILASKVDRGEIRLLEATTQAVAAAPGFFQVGHTYTREHHGDTIRFLVEHVSEAPDGSHRAAFGWRIRTWDVRWERFDSDDMDGWTDTTGEVTP